MRRHKKQMSILTPLFYLETNVPGPVRSIPCGPSSNYHDHQFVSPISIPWTGYKICFMGAVLAMCVLTSDIGCLVVK